MFSFPLRAFVTYSTHPRETNNPTQTNDMVDVTRLDELPLLFESLAATLEFFIGQFTTSVGDFQFVERRIRLTSTGFADPTVEKVSEIEDHE